MAIVTTYLCIGGPLHGQLQEVEGSPPVYEAVVRPSTPRARERRALGDQVGEYQPVTYYPWTPPVAGPLPADIDPDEHRARAQLGMLDAVAVDRARSHRRALLHDSLRHAEDTAQIATYADALYRLAEGRWTPGRPHEGEQ
jgi:hypothetical protein